jgi:hypothetical protein
MKDRKKERSTLCIRGYKISYEEERIQIKGYIDQYIGSNASYNQQTRRGLISDNR